MQLRSGLVEGCFFLTAQAACEAAGMWHTAQGDEDCAFLIIPRPKGWIAKVMMQPDKRFRGYVCDTGEYQLHTL